MARIKPLWVPTIRLLRVLARLLRPLALGLFLVVAVRLLGLPVAYRSQASAILMILVAYGLCWALLWEALAPLRPELRLVPFSDDHARRLATILRWLLLLVLGVELVLYLLDANDIHPAFAALLRLARNVGLVIVAWLAVTRSGLLARMRPEHVDSTWDLLLTWAARFVVPFAVLTAIAWLTLRAVGYLGLAQWVVTRAGWTTVAVVAVALLHWWIRNWQSQVIRFMRDETALAPADSSEEKGDAQGWIALDRTLRLLLQIAAVMATIAIVLRIWGIDTADITGALSHRLPLASDRTWLDLVRGAVQVAAVLLVGRILREILVFMVFPSQNTEVGARYAIVTVLKYVVIFIAVMVGASAVGFDMSAVAVFAGGAGVGLSFALKDILGNFFSGLILLFERPVRVGDVIEVGGVGGTVEAIRLRGTVIRAFDQSSIIIPNQQMIGERLKNLTQNRTLARFEVPVGVAYGSDLGKVEKLLLREARDFTALTTNPAPFVRLTGYGDSVVNMTLFCYTDRVGERGGIHNTLKKRVLAALTDAGIDMPFPQLDVNLRTLET